MRNTYAKIFLNNLKYNILNIKKKINLTKIMTVVKADAYGHGAVELVKYLENSPEIKPDYLGVAILDEAIELRNSGSQLPILVFSPIDLDEINFYIENNLNATIHSFFQIDAINNLQLTKPLNIHIKVDTGMGRIGFFPNELEKAFYLLDKMPNIKINGIYTHLSCSDNPNDDFSYKQLDIFNTVVSKLKANYDIGLVHAANSGAILNFPEAYFDMVRPGIMLYGYKPALESLDTVDLKPVMQLITKVNTIKEFEKNYPISYSRRYYTKAKTKIISLPLGYADGIKRQLTNKMRCIINDKYYPQVGTVCMDRIMFDIGNDDNIKIDDEVILLGETQNCKIDAWEWCNIINTIPYEITCSISKRIKRVYINE
ncbi:MAG TPA: alanine racemase [Ignavibacteriales bacterium]|mgnify:FL=1|nr:alanine racemase [Ignavibacteriales bacterium]